MNNIYTTIPLTEEELDKYFDNIENYIFIIDFKKIKLNEESILNYIYNSRMKCTFENIEFNEKLENILINYISTNKIISIDILNNIWIKILYFKINNKIDTKDNNEKEFIEKFTLKYSEYINELLSVLYCLKIFLINVIIRDKINAQEKTFNNIKNNFISLRNNDEFWLLLSSLDSLELEYYNYKNFDEPSFDGYKIAHYFYDEFTPLCLLKILDCEE